MILSRHGVEMALARTGRLWSQCIDACINKNKIERPAQPYTACPIQFVPVPNSILYSKLDILSFGKNE